MTSGLETISPRIQSLTNHPLLSNVRWVSATSASSIFFDVQFPNYCLLSSGISASHFDRPGIGIVRIEQRQTPDGCPDIFEPVLKSYRIDLPASSVASRLLFLNAIDSESPEERQLKIATIQRRPPSKTAPIKKEVELLTLPRQHQLPLLSSVNVESESDSSYVQYRLQFNITFANACLAAHTDALILEGRMPRRVSTAEPVYDWIWIKSKDAQPRCPEENAPVTKKFLLSHRVRSDSGRVIVLTNAVAETNSVHTQNQLVAFRIWPLPAKSLSLIRPFPTR